MNNFIQTYFSHYFAGVRTRTALSALLQKRRSAFAAAEIDRCEEVMEEAIGDRTVCITLHPGFESVCLNRRVLEVAALGLKMRAGKSYTTVRGQSNKSNDE